MVIKIYGTKTSTDKQKRARARRTRSRGVVTVPYLRGLSEQFRRISNRHSFRVVFKPGRKIKQIKRTCQEPLGDR